MSRTDSLRSLEVILESFLDRAVSLKAGRLQVLDGINRLDEIACASRGPDGMGRVELSDRVGDWFARHHRWIEDTSLRPADRNRLGDILAEIRQEIARTPARMWTPATEKITAEIDRWQTRMKATPVAGPEPPAARKLVLRKGPESLEEAGVHPSAPDSISLFAASLKAVTELFDESGRDRLHLMSVLNDSLKTATLQKNREALLLSALIIYYLKHNGYMVEPFVKRLKEAERLQKGVESHA